ncbi:hypothetical protein ALC53_07147 [Atta colombica]|uniref:Uncharacterized protein n=1 Tax=Atta colombica TaxID=520822 RepID=A0A195BDR9_9HYME|nr:hypothetical protein ALC53_07147 [Atta colombica]
MSLWAPKGLKSRAQRLNKLRALRVAGSLAYDVTEWADAIIDEVLAPHVNICRTKGSLVILKAPRVEYYGGSHGGFYHTSALCEAHSSKPNKPNGFVGTWDGNGSKVIGLNTNCAISFILASQEIISSWKDVEKLYLSKTRQAAFSADLQQSLSRTVSPTARQQVYIRLSTWLGKLHLCHVVSIHIVRKIGFSVNEESWAKGLESWRAVPSDCAEIYVSFRYDERLLFMTNCSGGAIFPEIEISLRTSGSINIAAKETRLGQSHATVIPKHIQEQRVKQDWSFSS